MSSSLDLNAAMSRPFLPMYSLGDSISCRPFMNSPGGRPPHKLPISMPYANFGVINCPLCRIRWHPNLKLWLLKGILGASARTYIATSVEVTVGIRKVLTDPCGLMAQPAISAARETVPFLVGAGGQIRRSASHKTGRWLPTIRLTAWLGHFRMPDIICYIV